MPEPTARQKLSDFAKRVVAAKDRSIEKAEGVGAALAPHVANFSAQAQAALEGAKAYTGGAAPGVLAPGVQGLVDNQNSARTAAEQSAPMEAAQRYLNSKQPLQNFANPELDAPVSSGKFLDPKDAAIQSLRESSDIYKAFVIRQELEKQRERLAAQGLTK